MQNNMMQQCLYHGGHIQGHTHMTFFFFAPNGKLFFFSIFIIECFYTRLMRPNKVETGRGLLT